MLYKLARKGGYFPKVFPLRKGRKMTLVTMGSWMQSFVQVSPPLLSILASSTRVSQFSWKHQVLPFSVLMPVKTTNGEMHPQYL